ncbi:MAG: hypothetical protein IPG17_33250 [Sandaracinaceae bacterium]|nr:hypothetical protein [Sandaracinaceae bacterium]
MADVQARFQSALTAHPGLAEPFVVFAPARLLREAGLALEDATGASLPLRDADGEGRSAALTRAMAGSPGVGGGGPARPGRPAGDRPARLRCAGRRDPALRPPTLMAG